MNALQVETCMLYMYFKETSLISHASLESSNKESINQSINISHNHLLHPAHHYISRAHCIRFGDGLTRQESRATSQYKDGLF